ncbi:MAG: DUF2098 family protein [Methanomassiliicoccales archaeon]
MNPGDYVKYRSTGTVGKVVETRNEGSEEWTLLDNDLRYLSSTLEPATEAMYKASYVKDRVKGLSYEDVEGLKEELSKVERYSAITASGGG